MKIYLMKGLFVGDDNPYRMLTAKNPNIWSKKETFDAIKKGATIEMEWLSGDENKPVGDFIMIGMSALASTRDLVQRLKKFAPKNPVCSIVVDGVDSGFQFIAPENHKPGDTGIAHLFMMFSQYKFLLVTQKFGYP